MEKLKQCMEQSFNERKVGILTQIEGYLNHKYPNIKVIYEAEEFIISGDELEADECRKEIEEVLNFPRKKNKNR